MPFENRGVEMGVTLNHPHGQIYAYNFVPPVMETFLRNAQAYWEQHRSPLLHDMARQELASGSRVVFRGEGFTSFVPVCARYPYETWIVPDERFRWMPDLDQNAIQRLAATLKTTLLKLDGLWERPMPYLMIFYQSPAPAAGEKQEAFTFHVQITPPYRTKDRLKYLAGTELGAGLFVNDSLPEEKAAELRAVEVPR
jgi:UDPglucose--hexose-1-phosphate uridylyltransferase